MTASMHGFAAAVSRAAAEPAPGPAAIAVGADGAGDEWRCLLTLRHTDGTQLTATLTFAGLDRLADLLCGLVDARAGSRTSTLQ